MTHKYVKLGMWDTQNHANWGNISHIIYLVALSPYINRNIMKSLNAVNRQPH